MIVVHTRSSENICSSNEVFMKKEKWGENMMKFILPQKMMVSPLVECYCIFLQVLKKFHPIYDQT